MYSYDRQAAEKVWHDIMNEAQAQYCADALKGVAKALKGKGGSMIKPRSFGSASGGILVGDPKTGLMVELSMGFRGGSIGEVSFEAEGKPLAPEKRHLKNKYEERVVVVNHNPTSFGVYISNMLKRAGWDLP